MAVTRDHPSRQASPLAERLRARTRERLRRREITVLAIVVGVPALALIGTLAVRRNAISNEASPEKATHTEAALEQAAGRQPAARTGVPVKNPSRSDDRVPADLAGPIPGDAVPAEDAAEIYRPRLTPEASTTDGVGDSGHGLGAESTRAMPAAREDEIGSDPLRADPRDGPDDRPSVVAVDDDRDKPAAKSAQAREPLRYQLLLPEPNSRGAPLIVMLHGTGGARAVWRQWSETARSRGYVVCLPISSGTGVEDPTSGNRRGDSARRWAVVDIPKLVDLARRLSKDQGADPSRVYIFGYSNGAFYAQQTALQHPEVFAAVVSIGGGCNLTSFPPAAKQVGVYMIHGTADRAVPLEIATQTKQRLLDAGLEEVILKEYPGRGHELFEEERDAVFDWLPRFRK